MESGSAPATKSVYRASGGGQRPSRHSYSGADSHPGEDPTAAQGKLVQEIKDAYAEVNSDGEVYKNAGIREEFLDARLEEVKWGVVLYRLKEQAREFFRVGLKELREVVDGLGIESTWTMESEASQYRETVALEASMRSNPEVRRKWLSDQATFSFDADDSEDAEQEFEEAGA